MRSTMRGSSLKDSTDQVTSLMEEPVDSPGFLTRGYAFYESGEYDRSIEDFKKAIDLDEKNVDAIYAQGMSLKASGRNEEAIITFNRVISLLDQGINIDKSRSRMLRRLALGHVNDIKTGDWNLEGEIWHRVG